MEHGRWAGFLPYEEQVRVPLMIKVPGIDAKRVNQMVSTIDVAPTLVGLLNPGEKNPFHGVSLIPTMMDTSHHLQREFIVSLCAFEDSYSIVWQGRYKMHYHRRENYALLYDLKEDPAERRNIIAEKPEIAAKLREHIAAFLWEGRSGFGNPYRYRQWTPPTSSD